MSTLNYISMSLDSLCILISLIILVSLFFDRDRKSKMNRLFRYLVLSNIGIVASDVVAWLMDGNTSRYAYYLVRISNFLHYAFGSLVLTTLTIYMLAYISLKVKINRRIVYTVLFLCGLSLLLTIVSQFTQMYYLIDENNVYHRQGLFWMSQVFPIFGLLINMGIILFYRKAMSRRAVMFFLLYMVMPVMTMSIQYMFYGITLVNVGTTLTILLLYIGVQIEQAINSELTITDINHQLEMQREYYKTLQTHITETKRARHDLRHHLSVFQSYIDKGETEKLADYVNEYRASLPDDTEIAFCENYAVNSILRHYIGIARSEGIQVDARLEMPEKTSVSDSDLCIIFGNCIENAIEACRRTDGDRFIKINSKITGKMFAVTIDNSFDGVIKKEGGMLFSRKHEGDGIGTSSVSAVAKKYDGEARFEANGNIFQTSVMLRTHRS